MCQNLYSAYTSAVLTTPAKPMPKHRNLEPKFKQPGKPRRKARAGKKISEPEKLARFISQKSFVSFYPVLVWVRGSRCYRAIALDLDSLKSARHTVAKCNRAFYITDEGTVGNLVPKRKRRGPRQRKPKKGGTKTPATIFLRRTGKWTM